MTARIGWLLVATLSLGACSAEVARRDRGGPSTRELLVELRAVSAEAARAHESGDYEAFREHSRRAARLVPGNPGLAYNLACGQVLTGQHDQALETLGRLADMGLVYDPVADADMAALVGRPELESLSVRFADAGRPVVRSVVGLRLEGDDLLPEGVAHDPASGDFFVSSVRRRGIKRVTAGGAVESLIADGGEEVLSVLGMAVDGDRRRLWTATAAVATMLGHDPVRDAGRSALLGVDLDSGEIRARIEPPPGAERSALNDVAVDGATGRVFVSDSPAGAVYVLEPGARALRVLVPVADLASPQGLVVADGGESLFVADYVLGLVLVDTATGEGELAPAPAGAVLAGIDGLAGDGRDLIAIQNGIRPHRVVRIRLAADGRRVEQVEVLEQAHPDYDEPTLGTVVGRDFYYVANSHWGCFDSEGRLIAPERLGGPTILRLALD